MVPALLVNYNVALLLCLCCIFSIRPYQDEKDADPFNTNSDYCHYDEAHDDYLYQEPWADYTIDLINNQGWTKEQWKEDFYNSTKQEIN